MLWDLSEVPGYRVHGRDGSLGVVTDLYVDDADWHVRYLAVTGGEKTGPGRFLLAPAMIRRIDREIGWLSVFLSQATVRNSPAVALGRNNPWPQASGLRAFYGLPTYDTERPASRATLSRLQSLRGLLGARVLAGEGDEEQGLLQDLVVDDHTWAVQGLAVDVSSWLAAGRVWLRAEGLKRRCGAKVPLTLTLPGASVFAHPPADHPLPLAPTWGPAATPEALGAVQLHEGTSAA